MQHYSRRTYSRRITVDDPAVLEAGDLVDISDTPQPCWAVVARTGDCAADPDAGEVCDGGCLGVIFFERGDGAGDGDPWHVDESDELRVRFPADTTREELDAARDR